MKPIYYESLSYKLAQSMHEQLKEQHRYKASWWKILVQIFRGW